VKRIFTGIILLCFFVTTSFSGTLYAVVPNVLPYPVVNAFCDLSTDIRNGFFELPPLLGEVQDISMSGKNGVIIHIQDAHCDYYAQRTIIKLIKHFREKYGIALICLEGGIGSYDLSPFTAIENNTVRYKAADFFLKQGSLSAAEFAAVEDPGRFLLWGMEDGALYRKNLQVYRESIRYKRRVDEDLKHLSYIVHNLKRHIYSDALFLLDLKYSQYKNNELPFKEYLSYLTEQARLNAIPLKTLHNIYLLKQVLEEEDRIDFHKANTERNKFIEALRERMSHNQVERLVERTVRFKEGDVAQKDFYNYLIEEGKKAGIRLSDYPSLQRYIVYISIYTSIDKSQMLEDLSRLEDLLRESMCASDKQMRLMLFSKRFTLMQKAFDFSLTKDDFDYFGKHMDDLRMDEFLSFIREQAPLYKIQAAVPERAVELDDRLKEIGKFYVYSFERDGVFVEHIEKKMKASGFHNAILITGGFHTENLTELLREQGFSYVTILPRFRHEEGYESPYFRILGGGYPRLGETIVKAVSSSTLQVASIWNRLGLEVEGEKGKNLAMIQLEIVKKLAVGQEAVLSIEGSDTVIRFLMEGEDVTYSTGKTGETGLADVRITDTHSFTYEDHEKIIDEQLRTARERGGIVLLDPAEEAPVRAARFFDAIGHEGIANAIRNGGVEERGINIYAVKGIAGFKGHASWRGVYVSAELGAREQASVIVRGIGAYYRQPDVLNKALGALYGKYSMGGKNAVAAVDLARFSGLEQMDSLRSPGDVVQGTRDYAIGLERFAEEPLPEAEAGADLLGSGEVRVQEGCLVFDNEEGGETRLRIVPSEPETISAETIEAIRARAEQIPFIDASELADFFAGTAEEKGWDILTIEDNFYTAGFVDVNEKKLYISELIRAAGRIAPEIIPIIILSEMSRPDLFPVVPPADIIEKLGMESPAMEGDTTLPEDFLQSLLRGLSGPKREALTEALNTEWLDTGPLIEAAAASAGEGFSEGEQYLIEMNRNRLIPGQRAVAGDVLGAGLIDQLFSGRYPFRLVMRAVRKADATQRGIEGLANAVYRLRPRSWVAFADVMGGKDMAQYLGEEVMDVLRSEATERVLRLAREKGVFAYHYGSDEHGFLFPDAYTGDDVERFFYDVKDELGKDPGYVLYKYDGPLAEIREALRGISGETGMRITTAKGAETHILVPAEDRERLLSALRDKGITLHEEPLYGFVLPAGVVRSAEGELSVDYHLMARKAERYAGEKWRDDEVRAMPSGEKQRLWGVRGLTEAQRRIVREAAEGTLSAGEAEKGILNDYAEVLKRGLPGFNKKLVSVKELDAKELLEPGEAPVNVMNEEVEGAFDNRRKKIRRDNRERIRRVLAGIREPAAPGRTKAREGLDDYTGYRQPVMEELLTRLFGMSPEEAGQLEPHQRLFMVRGPPIDFFIAMINRDGTVTVLNMDVMCHAGGLREEQKKILLKDFEEGSIGRLTDYSCINMQEVNKEYLRDIIEDCRGDNARIRKELNRLGTRLFSFKALNSYVTHGVADNYILAATVAIYDKLTEALEKDDYGGRGNINREGIETAAAEAARAIRGSINEQKLINAVKSANPDKPEGQIFAPGIMLEVVAVTGRAGGGESPGVKAKKCVQTIDKMRAVRDPLVVMEDGKIMPDSRGDHRDPLARIRMEDPGKIGDYEASAEKQKKDLGKRGKKAVERKTGFILSGSLEMEEALSRREAGKSVEKLYVSSGGVIGNVTDMAAPLVVFIPCSFLSQGQESGITNDVRRRMEQKYGTRDLKVILYDSRAELETASGRVENILINPRARAVVFCVEGSDVHPGEAPGRRDIFGDIVTPEGDPRVYYINENYEGCRRGAAPEDPLIGPHVALALGIKEFKAGNMDTELLQGISRLLADISGGSVAIMQKADDVIDLLNRLLDLGEALRIKRIDFRELRDQIEAEEAALISL